MRPVYDSSVRITNKRDDLKVNSAPSEIYYIAIYQSIELESYLICMWFWASDMSDEHERHSFETGSTLLWNLENYTSWTVFMYLYQVHEFYVLFMSQGCSIYMCVYVCVCIIIYLSPLRTGCTPLRGYIFRILYPSLCVVIPRKHFLLVNK